MSDYGTNAYACDALPSFGFLCSEIVIFKVIIYYSAKPGFFHENRANLFEVEPKSGMLLNTDNGTPMVQVK